MTVSDQRAGSALDAATAYFEAWNAHDGATVAALVTGTYVDPTLPSPVSGDDLAANVDGLCAAFPDLHFVHEGTHVDGDTVIARWRMCGTNDGAPLPGAPAPTNGTIDLAGVDVITTSDGAVVDVVGYFDQKTFVEQLGLQTAVMPASEWPVAFGIANCVDLGNVSAPGAISFTWVEATGAEGDEVRERGREVVMALAAEPGFIGFRGAFVGDRQQTLTLWTSPEAAEAALARNRPHVVAMERVFRDGLGARGFTSIWQPYKVNPQFATCPECGAYLPIPVGDSGLGCECGGTVEVSSYV